MQFGRSYEEFEVGATYKHWPGKTVTNVSEAGGFWEMGPEDQDYLLRFPRGCKQPFPRRSDRADNLPASG